MFESYSGSIDDSFLSETLHLEGEITTTGILRVAGLIDGDVKSRGVVVNPKDYYINKEDALFVIADDDPKDQLSDR